MKDAHFTSVLKNISAYLVLRKHQNITINPTVYLLSPPPSLSFFVVIKNIFTYSHSFLLPSPYYLSLELTSSRDVKVKWTLCPNGLYFLYSIESNKSKNTFEESASE